MLVLTVLGTLLIVLTYLLKEAAGSTRLARARLDRERAYALTAAAIERALQRLADDDDLLTDHLREPWAQPERIETPDGDLIETVIEDEQRRFDLNNLAVIPGTHPMLPPSDLVVDLLRFCGDSDPQPRVAALKDWIDADMDGPYELEFYIQANLPSRPPNAPLLSPDEIVFVHGFSSKWWHRGGAEGASDHCPPARVMTVLPSPHTHPVPVNLNTAPEELLLVLFGPGQRQLVNLVCTLRDTAPLRSLEPLVAVAEPVRALRLWAYVDVRSEWFSVHSTATTPRVRVHVHALVHRTSDGVVRVVRWDRGR